MILQNIKIFMFGGMCRNEGIGEEDRDLPG